MDQELKTKWLEALRSGKYKQSRYALYDGTGYCCLGIACVAAGIEPVNPDKVGNYSFDGELGFLPASVAQKLSMSRNGAFSNPTLTADDFGRSLHTYNPIFEFCSLTHLNDTYNFSFEDIAKVIEHPDTRWVSN